MKYLIASIFILFGNKLSSQTIVYKHDTLSRLIQVVYPDSSIIKYSYDAAGNRINKIIIQSTWIIWTGLTNNDWETSSNWNPNTVPGTSDNVLIPSTANQPIISNSTIASVKRIAIYFGASLMVNGKLYINGIISNRKIL